MQMGECPYDNCDDYQMRILPDVPLPVLSKETCPGCKRTIWIYYSRLDPKAYTDAQFAQAFEIDEKTKSVRERAAATHT